VKLKYSNQKFLLSPTPVLSETMNKQPGRIEDTTPIIQSF